MEVVCSTFLKQGDLVIVGGRYRMSAFKSGRRTQRKHFKECRENIWKDGKSDGDRGWEPFTTKNAAFDEYYKEQGIVYPDEWDTFIEVLRNPLPATFRINSSSQFCAYIRRKLENDIVKSIYEEGNEEVDSIRPLPWYPGNLAWHSDFSRSQLRKNQTLERFHEFLKLENEIGNITRQEAVSMVPPLLLDVHPDHFVLDMCAAPGSKTFQLLEIMNQSCAPGSLPLGMVIANDLDMKRCNLLIHQTKRICTANLVVSNNEAQHFPSCRLSKSCSTNTVKDVSHLQFDRVLCDVPCSGDGTLRKAPDIWRKWASGMGNGLHGLQIQIALRGVAVLKAGGRMVYSTCSMNPVEDEAVVAEVLRRCGDTIELVDVSNELPQLVRRPGLKKWKVLHKRCWYSSYSEVPKNQSFGVLPSLFPSRRFDHDTHDNGFIPEVRHCTEAEDIGTTSPSTAETSNFPLERCIRIMPHDQNSGAFFIAVFRKLCDPAVTDDSSHPNNEKSDKILCDGISKNSSKGKILHIDSVDSDDSNDNDKQDESVLEKYSHCEEAETLKAENEESASKSAGFKRKMNIQNRWRGIDPVVFFKDEAVINSIRTYYGIDSAFPLNEQLVVRSSDTNRVKRIYYISQSVRSILELNFAVALQLKIASVGVKMFERQTSMEGTASPCLFRISSEGLPLLLPHITNQILFSSFLLFRQLLQHKSIKFGEFSDAGFGEKASKLALGCCVVVLDKDGERVKSGDGYNRPGGWEVVIGCWRGRGSLSIMVAEADRLHLLDRLSEMTQ